MKSSPGIIKASVSEEQVFSIAARNEAILAAVPDIIVEVDDNKIYKWSNQAGYEFFGDDIIGKHADYFFVGDQETYSIVDPLFKGNESTIYLESWQRRKDGEKRLLAWWCRVLKDNEGAVIGALSTARDITIQRQAEEATREANEMNDLLFRTIPFGIDIVDESGTILYVNENLENEFPEKIVGKKCWEIYNDKKIQFKECPLKEGIEVGITKSFVVDGLMGSRTFQITHTGMMFHGKKVVLEIFQDITEKIEVEKKVMMLAHALESVTESVSITDIDDKIIFVNDAFQKTYGYSEEELLGKHIKIIRPPLLQQDQVNNILIGTIKGGWKGEIINRKKDGTLFPILLSTSVIKEANGRPLVLIGVATDITGIKKTEQELISAKEKAEQSDRLKSEFLANISHEIRTPMNGIVGFSTLLKEKELSVEQRNHFTDMINSSSQQLLTIINDIVEISKIETGQVNVVKSTTDVHRIMDDIYHRFLVETIRDKKISMTSVKPAGSGELLINTDEIKLQQILTCLVENAIKFTDSGSVEFGYQMNPGKEIEFFVKDTGIGIAKENHDLIFDRFQKIEHKESRLKSGIGLGLAISKAYIELMGGKIWLESELGSGSKFYFTLPCESESVSIKQAPEFVEEKGKRDEVTILIAEDDVSNFYLIREYLSKTPVRLIHVWNGEEALTVFKENPEISLVLMDIRMPRMDGYEATSEIRKLNDKIPIIAQTGFVFEEDIQKAKSLGFDGYMCKPINENDLLTIIRKYTKAFG